MKKYETKKSISEKGKKANQNIQSNDNIDDNNGYSTMLYLLYDYSTICVLYTYGIR